MTGAHLHITGLLWLVAGDAILNDVTLDVAAGTRRAIIGHNGAGKTSLLNAISGQVRPTAGRVLMDGHDITGWSPPRLARAGVARTWQHPALCESLTVAENLALAARSRADAMRIVEQNSFAAVAGERVGDLSYGQCRRVELAVAIASKPRLLLLDELSAGLAVAERDAVIAQLQHLGARTTVLMTAHDLDLIDAIADNVTILRHGSTIASDSGAQLRPNRESVASPAGGNDCPIAKSQAKLGVHQLNVSLNGRRILREINLDLHEGEVALLSGPNGCGKSTLLRAIAGLTPAEPGTVITLAGRRIDAAPTFRRARQGLVLVLQDRGIFADLTVAQNIRAGHNLGRRADHRHGPKPKDPFGLGTRAGARAGHLSGGQQQMLALTRAIQLQPQVLLLDEPFEGLDPASATALTQAIRSLAQQQTAILITGLPANAPSVQARLLSLDASGRLGSHT